MRVVHETEDTEPRTAGHDWLIWQLVDSAFPTGGFAHSGGLEAAWQQGEVRNGQDWAGYAESSLEQVGHASFPFINATHARPDTMIEVDALCEAFTTNHVANRASRSQGRAFLAAVRKIFSDQTQRSKPPESTPAESDELTSPLQAGHGWRVNEVRYGHLAPVFGGTTRLLGVPKTTALGLFLFCHVRGLAAAAVKLNVFGPLEAQRLQRRLEAPSMAILRRCENLSLDELAQTAPLLDLWQGSHDRLYSRLFQS